MARLVHLTDAEIIALRHGLEAEVARKRIDGDFGRDLIGKLDLAIVVAIVMPGPVREQLTGSLDAGEVVHA